MGDGDSSIEFLVTTLDGTVALSEVHHVAALIAEDLDFDVPGVDDVLLNIEIRVIECLPGLMLRRLECKSHFRLLANDAHSAPASSGDRFDDDGKSDDTGYL